ncbi:ribbon-helix-helix protein, CopG family [Paenibacillus sp. YIM B09110]|uniref:ribbon-helix-helix protein, CopG family n=1 Tax=Paenibacillus sp. YIM B09110 TaxID=3126102 RepID=UPI00301C9FB2
MVKVSLTLDDFSDKMLKLIAMENGVSRSEVIRSLVKARASNENGILRGFADLISKDK